MYSDTPTSRLRQASKQVRIAAELLGDDPRIEPELAELRSDIGRILALLAATDGTDTEDRVVPDGSGTDHDDAAATEGSDDGGSVPPVPGGLRGL